MTPLPKDCEWGRQNADENSQEQISPKLLVGWTMHSYLAICLASSTLFEYVRAVRPKHSSPTSISSRGKNINRVDSKDKNHIVSYWVVRKINCSNKGQILLAILYGKPDANLIQLFVPFSKCWEKASLFQHSHFHREPQEEEGRQTGTWGSGEGLAGESWQVCGNQRCYFRMGFLTGFSFHD